MSGAAVGSPTITVIAAVSDDGFIGKGGDLPWRLPADLKRFKQRTMGQALIMGRKTWDSIGRALPGRKTVVLSHGAPSLPEGVGLAHDLDEAIALAGDVDEVFIAGGEGIYALGLPRAQVLELTRVHTEIGDGDARFPPWDASQWHLVAEERVEAQPGQAHDVTFQRWERPADA